MRAVIAYTEPGFLLNMALALALALALAENRCHDISYATHGGGAAKTFGFPSPPRNSQDVAGLSDALIDRKLHGDLRPEYVTTRP